MNNLISKAWFFNVNRSYLMVVFICSNNLEQQESSCYILMFKWLLIQYGLLKKLPSAFAS